METASGSAEVRGRTRGAALTIGNFDGLHLGHQALLRAVVGRAQKAGRPSVVYTFDPHPRRVLNPDQPLPRLMCWPQLQEGIASFGVDWLIREPFTHEFAALSPEEFMETVVVERLQPSVIVVGRDFHFGKGRGGSGALLSELAAALRIGVEVIPNVRVDGSDVSSTRIREQLRAGDVEGAARGLGRPYEIWGRVVEGDRRGRTLGFPTANLEPENELLPHRGVYATWVRRFRGETPLEERLPAVTNVGTRPTFEAGRMLTEAHLLDFDGDLYGERLALAFHARIRDEQAFAGIDALKRQIALDAARARALLAPAAESA
jgi:riboflavin kinase/FMN adenylyltransferase